MRGSISSKARIETNETIDLEVFIRNAIQEKYPDHKYGYSPSIDDNKEAIANTTSDSSARRHMPKDNRETT